MFEWLSHSNRIWFFDKVAGIRLLGRRKKSPFSPARSGSFPADVAVRLTASAILLQEACKNAEPDFFRIGQELQSLYSGAVELTQQTIKAIRLIGEERSENVLSRVGNLVRESLFELESCQRDVSDNMERIGSIIDNLGDLHQTCTGVERIALFLRVVGLSIGIESSRSVSSKEMFALLGQEIKQLSDKVERIIRIIRDDSQSAQGYQSSAHSGISEGLRQLGELSYHAEKTMQGAVREIEHLMSLSYEALMQAWTHSREISKQVGEVVVGIQLHDSMSQRIEHIFRALHDAADLCAEGDSKTGVSDKRSERLKAAHSILLLQAAQLKQIISEILRVYETSKQSFEEIRSEVNELAHRLVELSLKETSETTEAGERIRAPHGDRESQDEAEEKVSTVNLPELKDPFTVLRGAIEHLGGLLDQGYHLFERTQGMAAQAFETALRLSGNVKHVRQINFETHLKALNAIVKAAHLGAEGRTLEVLAQEMKRVADQSNVFAAGVEEIIDSVMVSAHALKSRIREEAKERERVSLDAGLEEITRAYAQFREDASEVFHRTTSLKNSVTRTIADLHFLPELVEELGSHVRQLEETADMLKPWADEENGDPAAGPDKLIERYTMQRERDIHERLLDPLEEPKERDKEERMKEKEEEPGSESASVETTAGAKDKDEDDLGDNVELF